MESPLLEARDLRVDAHGVAVVDGLTFATEGARVIVVGAARALFEAASGVTKAARGSIAIRGEACADAVARTAIAGAALDPPMPAQWTALEHATWSARLAGRSANDAREAASQALAALGVIDAARAPLGKATPVARRATVLAGAIATGAPVIAMEDPTTGLDDEPAHVLARLAVAAMEAAKVTAWIAFASRAPLDSPLVQAADEALVIAGSSLAARGKPSVLAWGARRYAVDAQGAGDALAARLADRGARVDTLVAATGWTRFVVELPEGATTRDLFALAEDVGAIVVELRPLHHAFA